MAVERTLAILKPDCIRKNIAGKVIALIQENGFRIVAMKTVRMTRTIAERFYSVHNGQPFFDPLILFMSSGACLPMVLEKENAVADFRALIGATDPAKAADGTIRKLYADNNRENIVHGSDSAANGAAEIAFFFSSSELEHIEAG
jgi:nucleoside-diphosphate kinase